MDARHRIRIIAAAVAVSALTGGRAAASAEPPPNTELGRAMQQCIAADPDAAVLFDFYDGGLSVLVHSTFARVCMVQVMGLPEWVGRAVFVGVLTFGDWSVLGEGENFWILANEVAPDS
jgi:hypothetical protein